MKSRKTICEIARDHGRDARATFRNCGYSIDDAAPAITPVVRHD
jgi:hypothetical protein